MKHRGKNQAMRFNYHNSSLAIDKADKAIQRYKNYNGITIYNTCNSSNACYASCISIHEL